MEERVVADEVAGAMDGVAVAERLGLTDEADFAGLESGGLGVGGFVARAYDDADLLDSGGDGLFDEDSQDGFLVSVPVDERLQWESTLVSSRRGNYGLLDVQVRRSYLGVGPKGFFVTSIEWFTGAGTWARLQVDALSLLVATGEQQVLLSEILSGVSLQQPAGFNGANERAHEAAL